MAKAVKELGRRRLLVVGHASLALERIFRSETFLHPSSVDDESVETTLRRLTNSRRCVELPEHCTCRT